MTSSKTIMAGRSPTPIGGSTRLGYDGSRGPLSRSSTRFEQNGEKLPGPARSSALVSHLDPSCRAGTLPYLCSLRLSNLTVSALIPEGQGRLVKLGPGAPAGDVSHDKAQESGTA